MNSRLDKMSFSESERYLLHDYLHTPDRKRKKLKCDDTFYDSNSLDKQTIPVSRVDSTKELSPDENFRRNEFKKLQTPPVSLDYTFIDDKENSSPNNVFKNSEIISSTPIVNNNRNKYKTPEQRRKLLNFCSGTDRNHSPCLTLSCESKYLPVSSPSSSEILKLNDSRFLNDSTSYCQQFCVSKSSVISGFDEIEETYDRTLCNNDCTGKSDSILMTDTDIEKQSFILNDSINTNLKFKSFDLLPGVRPLDD